MTAAHLLTIPHLNRKTLARLFGQIEVDRVTGCWNWTGYRNVGGYGRATLRYQNVTTHRVMYAWLVGPIPNGRHRDIPQIDHFVCSNRACCNPVHLRLVTPAENVLRSNGPCAKNACKTHCKRGHLLPDERNNGGSRACKECMAMHGRFAYRAKLMSADGEAFVGKLAARQRARMNGPRREELLAQKRAHYHATKTLKRPKP